MTAPEAATIPKVATGDSPAADLYLELIAKMLTRYGFEGRNATVKLPKWSYEDYLWGMLRGAMPGRDVRMVEAGDFDAERRENGRDWPADAETMVGSKRLRNIRECTETVLADGVPGDLIETGSWRGGATIYMRAVLKAYGVTDRNVFVCDSFEGLPAPDGRYDADAGAQFHTKLDLAISREQVEDNFRRYDLLDDQVKFLVGWFADTLPTAPIESIAVLRLDGDMYASTMDAFDALYDKVSPGGFVIVDDYGALPECAAATEDFRKARGITDTLETIDWTGRFWRKSVAHSEPSVSDPVSDPESDPASDPGTVRGAEWGVDKRVGLLTRDLSTTRRHSERALKDMYRSVRSEMVKARRARDAARERAEAAEALLSSQRERLADLQARLKSQRKRAQAAEKRAEQAEAELADLRGSATWKVGRAALAVPKRARRLGRR